MLLTFGTACCGVTEAGAIWAAADGETLEVDAVLGAEMLRVGYAVLAQAAKAEAPKAKPKAKQAE